MRYETAKELSRSHFKRSYGVYPEIFETMVKVAKVERMLQKKTGRNDKLIIEDQVLMTLSYWREYRTYFHLGQNWGINESTAYRIIRRVEDTLIKSGLFALPGKKVLIEPETEIETVVIDVTEHEVERPQKSECVISEGVISRKPRNVRPPELREPRNAFWHSRQQKSYYSGKQKKHTIKSQLVVDLNTRRIVCVAQGKGKQHDFKIWKKSRTCAQSSTKYLADKGYQGIQKMHANSQTPIKKKRGQKLERETKRINRELAKKRIVIEHINRCLKIFRLFSYRYRNRRKRFNLRLSLISGIYNYGLDSQCKLAIS